MNNHQKFLSLIELFEKQCDLLLNMQAVTISTVPSNCPVGGIYLFSCEHTGLPLYVGRTKRSIKTRVKNHISSADDCPFAWHLARDITNNKDVKYSGTGTRKKLLENDAFRKAYCESKKRIEMMPLRYVGEADPTKQALLEIYVATVIDAKHNDFGTS
jgi:hypothetical protein